MIDFVIARKNIILALAILFVVVSLSGTTYSLFFQSETTEEFNYNTGNLDLQFVEDEKIKLANAFPIVDSEGVKSEPYKLTVKNTGSVAYMFDLRMLTSTDENTIDTKYIKVQVNDSFPKTLYNISGTIASSVILYPGEEITYNIKIWLDYNTPNQELGKVFEAKVVTSGESFYKTIDSSGANHPVLMDGMIPVYYVDGKWRKADTSNMSSEYVWYNYGEQKWANVVTIKDSYRQIYDIAGGNNLKIDELKTNNGNVIIEENYFDLNFKYNNNVISNIMRIKFDSLTSDKVYIISNGNLSYYYDTVAKKFTFQVGSVMINSSIFELDENKWYILGYTYDGEKVSYYVDGVRISTSNISGNAGSLHSFKLGTDSSFKEVSSITIGDVYFYDDILSSDEILNNYKSSINVIYDSLILGYNEFTPMTLSERYLSYDIGEEILSNDILSFYVWIPRFKYKLWNVTGIGNNLDSIYNKGIDVSFENGIVSSGMIYCEKLQCYSDNLMITRVTDADNGKYYTHPAFSNVESAVKGFWVGKYEMARDNDDTVSLRHGNNTWINNSLSNFYQVIKKIDPAKNYRIIKNTEWGAIAYLSYSKYGICPLGVCQEMVANTTNVLGGNEKDSTTGNMYGVFDMNGNATEFVMGNYVMPDGSISVEGSDFGTIPISNNDYDAYMQNGFILGDATKEITLNDMSLDNGRAVFVSDTNNWFVRGGIGGTENANMFNYSATGDIANEHITTRIVIK